MRVYVDGVFDLFHYGHAEMLERVRAKFGSSVIICVGVCTDADCISYKRPPIMNQEERIRSVKQCKHVDEVISDAPWIIDEAFLKKHKIDYICHDGAPYNAPGTEDVYAFVKSLGIFHHMPRTEGICTTELIKRIISATS